MRHLLYSSAVDQGNERESVSRAPHAILGSDEEHAGEDYRSTSGFGVGMNTRSVDSFVFVPCSL